MDEPGEDSGDTTTALSDDIGLSGREAVLDLVLAEELSVDHGFAQWFLTEAVTWRVQPKFPRSEIDHVRVRVNLWDDSPDLPADALGETDVDVVVRWDDGHERAVLVENKVWAVFQDRQPERYIARATSRDGLAVLVAPASYIATHMTEVGVFDGVVTVEAIAARIRANPPAGDPTSVRRAEWRARVLEEVVRPRALVPVIDDPDTVAFTEFCVSWFVENAPSVVPHARSNHTRGQGWLWFESPPGLVYKASGWARKLRAGVDLYVSEHGYTGTADELARCLQDVGPPEGFRITTDTAKVPNVVLRYDCDQVPPSEGAPLVDSDKERSVVEALQACAAAAMWLREHRSLLISSAVSDA